LLSAEKNYAAGTELCGDRLDQLRNWVGVTARSETVQFVEHEDVMHTCERTRPRLLFDSLLEKRGDHETLKVSIGQALYVNHDRQAGFQVPDIQWVARSAFQPKNA